MMNHWLYCTESVYMHTCEEHIAVFLCNIKIETDPNEYTNLNKIKAVLIKSVGV